MKGRIVGDVALILSERDNVATALDDLQAGETIDAGDRSFPLREDVRFGHKFALRDLESGERIYKYGERIGVATEPVRAGEWVHTHNCESTRGRGDVTKAASDAGGERP